MSKVSTKSGRQSAAEANKIYPLTTDKKLFFNRLWIYPAKAIASNKLTANTGDIYVGERTDGDIDCTPDKLTNADLPLLIELPQGETKQLCDVIFQADNAGDGVFYKFW